MICRPLARYLLVALEAWQASHDLQQSFDEQVVANRRYDANARAIAALEERAEGNRARVAEMRAESAPTASPPSDPFLSSSLRIGR